MGKRVTIASPSTTWTSVYTLCPFGQQSTPNETVKDQRAISPRELSNFESVLIILLNEGRVVVSVRIESGLSVSGTRRACVWEARDRQTGRHWQSLSLLASRKERRASTGISHTQKQADIVPCPRPFVPNGSRTRRRDY